MRKTDLGAVDLVARDGHQVYVHLVDVQRNLAHCLSCVCVEEDFPASAETSDFFYRLGRGRGREGAAGSDCSFTVGVQY